MIVGGGEVGLIPCDLGCINGIDSFLHFFFFFFESFVLILGIIFGSIGSWWWLVDCCWWWRAMLVSGGRFMTVLYLCLCIVVSFYFVFFL